MKLTNKYYSVESDESNVLWFLPGSRDLPNGNFILDREELDRYIGTLEVLREYLYD